MEAPDSNTSAGCGSGSVESRSAAEITQRPKAFLREGRPLRSARGRSQRPAFAAKRLGTVCLLDVSGEIDFYSSPALEIAMASAACGHGGAVVVSFAGCSFVDCSCMSVLIRQFKKLVTRLFIIAPLATALGRLLDMAQLRSSLPVHSSLRQAYLALSSDPDRSLGDLATWA